MKKISAICVCLLVFGSAWAANRTTVQDGAWNTPATWGGATSIVLPGNSVGDTATVKHNVDLVTTPNNALAWTTLGAAGASGNLTVKKISQYGNLTTGQLNVGNVANEGSLTSTLTILKDGTVTVTTNTIVGQNADTGMSGVIAIMGGTFSVQNGFNLAKGKLSISGSTGNIAISTTNTIASTIINFSERSQVEFIFDEAGVASIDFTGDGVRVQSGALFSVDGSAYTGGTNTFVLMDNVGAFVANNGGNSLGWDQANISVTGFDSFSTSVQHVGDQIVLTVIPEPATVGLFVISSISLLAVRKHLLR